MNDFDTDEARVARRERLAKVRPLAAREAICKSDYDREYVEPCIVVIDNLKGAEEATKSLFCPSCRTDMKSGLTQVRRLHIGYEQDPLNNYPMIATVRCAGCDYVEMIPVMEEKLSDEDRRDSHNYAMSMEQSTSWQSMQQQHYAQQTAAQARAYEQMRMQQGVGLYPAYANMSSPTILGFGQHIADGVWGDIDRVIEARKHAHAWREKEKERLQRDQMMNSVGKAMGKPIDQSIMDIYNNKVFNPVLDNATLKAAIDKLGQQDVPPDVKRSMMEKYWTKFVKKHR